MLELEEFLWRAEQLSREHLHILQIICRHVDLSNDEVILLAEKVLAHLLPDVLHRLAVWTPGCVEFNKHRDAGLWGNRVEVVSNKYCDRSETTLFNTTSSLIFLPGVPIFWELLLV